ncbi:MULTISPECIES: hypothetical protein [Gammaproteobacteria]|uniref:hypothetical protein n=1 Tax=Gammaproteobacteria TaxID=1236 RepID=UPI003A8CCFF4
MAINHGDPRQGAAIADELGISHQEWKALKAEIDPVLAADDTTVTGYYFEVPASADAALLAKTGWIPGLLVALSLTAVGTQPRQS